MLGCGMSEGGQPCGLLSQLSLPPGKDEGAAGSRPPGGGVGMSPAALSCFRRQRWSGRLRSRQSWTGTFPPPVLSASGLSRKPPLPFSDFLLLVILPARRQQGRGPQWLAMSVCQGPASPGMAPRAPAVLQMRPHSRWRVFLLPPCPGALVSAPSLLTAPGCLPTPQWAACVSLCPAALWVAWSLHPASGRAGAGSWRSGRTPGPSPGLLLQTLLM